MSDHIFRWLFYVLIYIVFVAVPLKCIRRIWKRFRRRKYCGRTWLYLFIFLDHILIMLLKETGYFKWIFVWYFREFQCKPGTRIVACLWCDTWWKSFMIRSWTLLIRWQLTIFGPFHPLCIYSYKGWTCYLYKILDDFSVAA